MPKIVISYRRDDSLGITGRIFDRLAARYGRESVFRDIDDIPLGSDFRVRISDAVRESDVLLVVIGSKWAGGRRQKARILDPEDPVRVEVETALTNDIPVIPILVKPVTMPKVLPDSLKDFPFCNALRLDPAEDFDYDINRLVRELDKALVDGT